MSGSDYYHSPPHTITREEYYRRRAEAEAEGYPRRKVMPRTLRGDEHAV